MKKGWTDRGRRKEKIWEGSYECGRRRIVSGCSNGVLRWDAGRALQAALRITE